MVETAEQRAKRRSQRLLFDRVADLYDATRRGYPAEIIEYMVTTSGVGPGDAVLEIGCGTGQLTRQLVPFGFDLTAIDIGPAMVATTRQHVGGSAARLEVVSFEDFDAPGDTFALVCSATAFHWVDPDVAWVKAARLLRPGGWLAVLATGEHYDDPVGARLLDLWIECSSDGGAWTREKKAPLAETIGTTGLFAPAVEQSHTERLTLGADVVVGLEHTRATSLSYGPPTRHRFDQGLHALLDGLTEVGVRQQTSVTMAQRLPIS